MAGGEGGGGVGVVSAEAIPRVDVLTEDNEFDAADGLLIELGRYAVERGQLEQPWEVKSSTRMETTRGILLGVRAGSEKGYERA